MARIYSLFSLFVVAAFGVSLSEQGRCDGLNAGTLQFLHVLFRHGYRTPSGPYPNDPYNNDYWAAWGPPGTLTSIGIEQDFFAGKWIRECYDGFLSSTYSPLDVYVRAADKDRYLQSAEARLAGLFPPKGRQIWSWAPIARVARNWQPIAVHTVPTNQEYLLISTTKCPNYEQLQSDAWKNNPQLAGIQADNQDLLNYIASNAGYSLPGQLSEISINLWDPVILEKRAGLVLPAWLNKTVLHALREWKDLWVQAELGTEQQIRFGAGPLVADLIDTLTKKSQGSLSQDFYLYSGQNNVLAALMAAYESFDGVEPPFGSNVITELHRDNANKWFVKAYYVLRNGTPQPLVGPVPLSTFIQSIQKYRLDDKPSACVA